jgi:hypothetical protein
VWIKGKFENSQLILNMIQIGLTFSPVEMQGHQIFGNVLCG